MSPLMILFYHIIVWRQILRCCVHCFQERTPRILPSGEEEQEEKAIGNLPPSLPPFGSSRVTVLNLTYSIGLCNDKIEQAILFHLT